MISKTRQSGREDLLVRMLPELKRRIEEAARREGMTRNDWVLKSIETILKVQELHAETDREIEKIRQQQDAKFDELLALLARQQNLGDLAKLVGKKRRALETTAEKQLDNWRLKEITYGVSVSETEVERLCKEYKDLGEEIRCLCDAEFNRAQIERIERERFGGDLDEYDEFYEEED